MARARGTALGPGADGGLGAEGAHSNRPRGTPGLSLPGLTSLTLSLCVRQLAASSRWTVATVKGFLMCREHPRWSWSRQAAHRDVTLGGMTPGRQVKALRTGSSCSGHKDAWGPRAGTQAGRWPPERLDLGPVTSHRPEALECSRKAWMCRGRAVTGTWTGREGPGDGASWTQRRTGR